MKPAVLVGLMGSGRSPITARTGRTVRELWEEGGEAAYRHLESDEVLRIPRAGSPAVLAAPGSVVRPQQALATLAEARGGLYEQVATAIVDTDDLVPEAVAGIVVELLAGGRADT